MQFAWLALLVLPVALALGWGALTHAMHASWHWRAGASAPRLGVRGLVAYHLRETAAFVRLGWWHVRAFFADGLRRPAVVSGRPVLFVHGFTQNGTNGWGLRRRLEALGRPTVAVSMGRPFRGIATHARPVLARLRDLAREFPDGVDVVAHSMGGVVLRHVLAENPDLAGLLRRVVTLGSPHRGTALRGVSSPRWAIDVAELGIGSRFLDALPDLSTLVPHAVITTVAARTDLIVYPSTNCHLPGTCAVDLDDVGHAGLLAWRRAQDVVVEALS